MWKWYKSTSLLWKLKLGKEVGRLINHLSYRGYPAIEGILPKGPYLPCLRMADGALLAGYPRYHHRISLQTCVKEISAWKSYYVTFTFHSIKFGSIFAVTESIKTPEQKVTPCLTEMSLFSWMMYNGLGHQGVVVLLPVLLPIELMGKPGNKTAVAPWPDPSHN